jgi:hypothetical protein
MSAEKKDITSDIIQSLAERNKCSYNIAELALHVASNDTKIKLIYPIHPVRSDLIISRVALLIHLFKKYVISKQINTEGLTRTPLSDIMNHINNIINACPAEYTRDQIFDKLKSLPRPQTGGKMKKSRQQTGGKMKKSRKKLSKQLSKKNRSRS